VRAARIISASGVESSLRCIGFMSVITESKFNDGVDDRFHFEYAPSANNGRSSWDNALFCTFVIDQMKEHGGIDFS
jgi:hypothetical protein